MGRAVKTFWLYVVLVFALTIKWTIEEFLEDPPPVKKSRWHGFDNTKPAPWQEEGNLEEIIKKYDL